MPDMSLTLPLSPLGLAVVVLALALGILWVIKFAHLMSLSDRHFPGPFVRFGWVAAFLLLWMAAPFAYMVWWSRQSDRRDRRVAHAAD